jgi:hypothetical protein
MTTAVDRSTTVVNSLALDRLDAHLRDWVAARQIPGCTVDPFGGSVRELLDVSA